MAKFVESITARTRRKLFFVVAKIENCFLAGKMAKQLCMVVCEVPEAGLSVKDKTTDSDEVYFNTKHDCTVYTQVEIS